MKVIKYVIIILVFVYSCGKNNIENGSIIVLTDDLNNTISLNKYPEKIVSLAPNITETLFEIGADSLILGVTQYCDYPESAKNKFKVGGMIDPDIEKIISINPDLVLLTVEGNSISTYKTLMNLGFKVFVCNPRNFDGVIKMITDLGNLTNKKNKSEILIKRMKAKRNEILSKVQNNKLDSCCIVISVAPLMTTNKSTFINEIVKLSGLINCYSEEASPYPEISWEDLISRKPNYFIIPVNNRDTLNNYNIINTLYEKLKLNLNSENLITVDENLFFRPGPRMLLASEKIYSKINN